MRPILVGMFDTRRDADLARQALLDAGFADRRIEVEPPGDADGSAAFAELPPEDRGLAGFVERMFSGAMLDAGSIDKYRDAACSGSFIVALHGVDDARLPQARAILERYGRVDEHRTEGGAREPSPHSGASAQSISPAEESVIASPGPSPHALPNAPTDWGQARAGSRASTGTLDHDPARPEGLTRGTLALGPVADRNVLGASLRDQRHAGPADSADPGPIHTRSTAGAIGAAAGSSEPPGVDAERGRDVQSDALARVAEVAGATTGDDDTQGGSPDAKGHRVAGEQGAPGGPASEAALSNPAKRS